MFATVIFEMDPPEKIYRNLSSGEGTIEPMTPFRITLMSPFLTSSMQRSLVFSSSTT